ncbi:MAG: hypothetical protein RR800_00485 [Comamonas sp.]
MTPAASRKHLSKVLAKLEKREAELQQSHGDAYPRSVRTFDQKTIQALKTILAEPD